MRRILLSASALALAAVSACTHTNGAHSHATHAHTGGVIAPSTATAPAPFDIVHAKITSSGGIATFHMAVSGEAGQTRPTATGQFAGSQVFSYVWPTTIDPYEVGFEHGAGILSLAVTAHPDFDDTPLYDETRDGDKANDGGLWHTHWVVLGPDPVCGEGALKVIDIPVGQRPRLPQTWPGAPILIDSPDIKPTLDRDTVEVRVPFANIAVVEAAGFDGVTAGLRVNASAHAPLLCVANVFDVASGDLSLPGRVNR